MNTLLINYVAYILVILTGCTAANSDMAQSVLNYVLQGLFIVITPLLLLLAKKLVEILEKKTGLTVTEHQIAMINDAVYKGVAYAEEQSRKALKLNTANIDSVAKKELAIQYVLDSLQPTKVDKMDPEFISKLIEARVHLQRSRVPEERAIS